jgi:hypothetical protein
MIDPVAPDQQLFSQNAFSGKSEFVRHPVRCLIAHCYPHHHLVEAKPSECLAEYGGCSLGANAF